MPLGLLKRSLNFHLEVSSVGRVFRLLRTVGGGAGVGGVGGERKRRLGLYILPGPEKSLFSCYKKNRVK